MSTTQLVDYCAEKIGYQYCIFSDTFTHRKKPIPVLPPDYFVEVPCGKCFECRKRHRLEWSIRLIHEIQRFRECTFVTLTLDDDSLKRFESEPKTPLKLFIDRLRKHLGFRPRYWFTSELGEENGRLHYHGIFFGTSKKDFPMSVQREKWQYGHVWIGYARFDTANYITKYLLKGTKDYKPFIMCSNGIGLSYLTPSRRDYHINGFDFRMYINHDSRLYPLSTYYRNHLFDDDMKLCKMLNVLTDVTPKKYIYKGVEYKDLKSYISALYMWYDWGAKNHLNY